MIDTKKIVFKGSNGYYVFIRGMAHAHRKEFYDEIKKEMNSFSKKEYIYLYEDNGGRLRGFSVLSFIFDVIFYELYVLFLSSIEILMKVNSDRDGAQLNNETHQSVHINNKTLEVKNFREIYNMDISRGDFTRYVREKSFLYYASIFFNGLFSFSIIIGGFFFNREIYEGLKKKKIRKTIGLCVLIFFVISLFVKLGFMALLYLFIYGIFSWYVLQFLLVKEDSIFNDDFIIRERNIHMARNICIHNARMKNIYVSVGEGHLEGIKKILEQSGFVEYE